ncbi:ABC transporter permease [Phocicoccus pinnipedialis]|uniref:Glycine betaine/carnitine/choline transport system permease protein OpuCB n=1 Tax=Phocicoccus pinnipedialis TaxID=110845 RepID=A0A6V7R3S6_9BACL|nr:ABC transporter permease [Jeotgalicoccus pinnipedialis]MBP1939993.1 osmoprotectant transport system permease protein [Jeotgalicoccus pinnipedialis]CAD2072059.1 Glycine betaine/carnitine/choline transport system permease protein OpuCB [Jeotgalicoccus pinnipedialis]
MNEFFTNYGLELVQKTWEHFYISIIALLIGVVIAVPVGMLLARTNKLGNWILMIAGVLQTIPTLAVLALMIPLFGIGKIPAIIALSMYILLPILNNTIIGVRNIDQNAKEAALSMGMTRLQLMSQVELPLATPLILSGIRLASVYVISWATIASYIGAGGLGDFIFNGLNLYDPVMIIIGTVAVTVLALLTDKILGLVERYAVPKGINISR